MATSRNKIRLKKDTYIQTDWYEEWNGSSVCKCAYNNNNNTVNIIGNKNGQCAWSRNNNNSNSNKISDQLRKSSFQSGSVCDNKKHLSSYSVISNYNNNIIGRNYSNISNYNINNNNNSNVNNTSNSNRSINRHLNNKSKLSLTYRNCISFTNITTTNTNTNTNSANESNYKHFQLKSFKPLYSTKSNINIKQHHSTNTTTTPYIIDKKHTKNILTPYKFRNMMKDMLKRSFSRKQHKQPLKSISNVLPELNIDTCVNPYKDMDINSEYKRKVIDDDIQLTLKDELKRAKDIVEFKRKYHSRNGKGKKCNNNVKYVSLFKSNTKENTNGFKDYFTFETPFMHLNRELKQRELIKDQNVVSQLFINNFKKFK